MINQLFEHPYALNRYLTGPLLEKRLAYLRHCAEQGFAQSSLRLIAHYQLVVTDYLDLQTARAVTPSEIEAAADRWAQRPFQTLNPNGLFHFAPAIDLSGMPLTGCVFWDVCRNRLRFLAPLRR